MSVQYRAVLWNPQKRIYDAVLAGSILFYLALFVGVGALIHPNATAETLLIRGLGTAALLLLHFILCIGPLARLDRRFLPLLYNRRHLGVTMFVLALAHGAFSLVQFYALGVKPPLDALFIANTRWTSLAHFPFEPIGFIALLILFLMAATSHDFWLHNLTAPIWKALHMLVYVAYALLIAHVVLGALQTERGPLPALVLGVGLLIVTGLHLAAGQKEARADAVAAPMADPEGFLEVCEASRIPESRAVVIPVGEERVAIFRHNGKVSAISNVCRHQNGPLGEGKIIDGCVTCPWHGYQYRPEDGTSPPPFNDKVATFRTKVVDGKVLVHPCANPSGTFVEPSRL
jgi:methionine sulfoxide reductase heme-binding subunit